MKYNVVRIAAVHDGLTVFRRACICGDPINRNRKKDDHFRLFPIKLKYSLTVPNRLPVLRPET